MTSPDMTSRIEAAARACLRNKFGDAPEAFDALSAPLKDYYRRQAVRVLKAFEPGLFTDPPSAWLAPWEASEAMLGAMYCAQEEDRGRADNQRELIRVKNRPRWLAARDAHLSPKHEEQDG